MERDSIISRDRLEEGREGADKRGAWGRTVEEETHQVLDDRSWLQAVKWLADELAELLASLGVWRRGELSAVLDEVVEAVDEKDVVKDFDEDICEDEVLEDDVDHLRKGQGEEEEIGEEGKGSRGRGERK
jgi:hypothetical protein